MVWVIINIIAIATYRSLGTHPSLVKQFWQGGVEMDWKRNDVHRIVVLDPCLHHVTS